MEVSRTFVLQGGVATLGPGESPTPNPSPVPPRSEASLEEAGAAAAPSEATSVDVLSEDAKDATDVDDDEE